MNNEILRKLTSLTLLTILLGSSVTFAVPGVMPVAEAAHNANLFVSAENSQFSNYFAGPQVIEVVINDNDIRSLDDVHGEPDVTVNGKKIRMAQATDGNWYGYFASKLQAQAADQTAIGPAAGKGLDFGTFCDQSTVLGTATFTQTVGIAVRGNPGAGTDGTAPLVACTNADGVAPLNQHVVRENKTLNAQILSSGLGQIGLPKNVFPIIQLYDFAVGGNVIVKYNKGGGTQTTTLTFDSIPTNLIKTQLDRTTYPLAAEVHTTLTDSQLNIDPTDEDSWTWDTNAASNRLFYQAFDENGGVDANGGPGMVNQIPNEPTFMFEKNGKMTVNLAAQGIAVGAFGLNADESAIPADATATPLTGAMTFVELDPKGGVFGNYDENDNANLNILNPAIPGTIRGKSATISYNDVTTSIVVGFGYGTIDINVPDGTWNSGEEVPVTLVDTDANKNTRADEDLDVFNPDVTQIPTLKIGNPFTLAAGDEAAFYSDVVPVCAGVVCTLTSTAVASGATVTVDQFGQRERITPTSGGPFSIGTNGGVLIDLNRSVEDLQKSIKNPFTASGSKFKGYNLFNYDVRSLSKDATGSGVNTVDAYLVINRTGSVANAIDPTAGLATLTAVQLADNKPLQGLLNLNRTATGAIDPVNLHPIDTEITTALFDTTLTGNLPTDKIGLLFVLNSVTTVLNTNTKPIVADFFTSGLVGDGVLPKERINNSIYRFELEETGDNTSTFTGSAEYTMLNQLNIFDAATYDNLRTIDSKVRFLVHEDLDDEQSPRINYLDLGTDGVLSTLADQQAAGTSSAVVSFDKDSYKTADTVVVTVQDADLNVDSDVIDIYTTVGLAGDPAQDTVGKPGLGKYINGDPFGRLLDITFDDANWQVPTPGVCATALALTGGDLGLSTTGFSLVETSKDSGIFKGDFEIPATYCPIGAEDALPVTTNGLDIAVDYEDFRDASGNTIEVGDSGGIRANTGSVSLDRTVYPVPFGEVTDFPDPAVKTSSKPSGRAFFPVHETAIGNTHILSTDPTTAKFTLGNGDVLTHIRVNDPDFDVDPAGEDKIAQNVAGTDVGPVKVTISRGSSVVTIAYAGGPTATPGVIDVGDDNVPVGAGTTELGPMTEIAPSAGIFQVDVPLKFSDGPVDQKCPKSTAAIQARFDVVADKHCILQGDILTVEYTDPSDSSGDQNTVTDSATFDLRNGVLQSDKSVYIIGADMILTLIEPDLNLNADETETYDLDLIEWDSDAATVTMGDLGGAVSNNGGAFDPEPNAFRETGDNTGIFQVVAEIPAELGGKQLNRGEQIQLQYTDWGPSGANFVGDEDQDVNLTIYTSNFGATVELDQKVYTWTDKVFITIVAPDHNFDSNLIDKIGNTKTDEVRVATRGHKLSQYALTETGTDTGIFTGEVILTGFCHNADGDTNTGVQAGAVDPICAKGDDTNPRSGNAVRGTAVGPTDGFLESRDDDGLTVSFEFTEDETVVGSALIRWNIGEVQFLEASYPATGQGVVRVVDPDMNLNPEAVDNFDISTWSDSDAGGIDLTVTETNEATGIFEGTVFFTVTDQSSGHRLRVAEGDTVTAQYQDNTLPSPYTTADELEITATTFIGSIVPPLERAPASNPRIVDAFGNELSEANVDQQIQVVADLANGQDRDQPFAYLVQIQDSAGVTVSLSWITGSLAPGQSLNPAQSWTPTSAGTYNVQIFVWQSVDNPDALSPPVSTTLSVV